MSRIVFFCIPAHGHTNPTLNVVRELTARGHQVWYYSYEIFHEKIEAAGAQFISCDGYGPEQTLSPSDASRVGKDLVLSMRILVETTLALDGKVCADMKRLRPDCIVADSMAVWGKAVAQKLVIPFVSSTTTFAFNRFSAKIMPQSPLQALKMLCSLPRSNRLVRRLREKGYPVRSALDILQNSADTHTIVYTSPEFQPCADTFSDRYAFVGPSVRPASSEIRKTREKLVYISMGTVVNTLPDFYRDCISAFRNTTYQVILSVGNQIDPGSFGPLPEHISVFQSVDQIAVLQKADVFISHCGMNSVNESLYFGVPLVMLPQTAEQGGVAERVSQLSAGVKLRLPKTRASLKKLLPAQQNTAPESEAAILNAVETIFSNPEYRQNADRISKSFRNCPGAAGAADKILEVCQAPS